MASTFLPFSRSAFRAATDLLVVLDEADEAGLLLADSEVQAIAYFGRVVAHAWHEYDVGSKWLMPYEFTYGTHGGPISEEITKVVDHFLALGYIRWDLPEPRTDIRLLHLTKAGNQISRKIVNDSHDPVGAAHFIKRTCRAGATLSVPGLMSAIQREPSLYNARAQRLRVGVPLGHRQNEIVAFITGLLQKLDESYLLKHKPEILALVLLDALRWREEEVGQ